MKYNELKKDDILVYHEGKDPIRVFIIKNIDDEEILGYYFSCITKLDNVKQIVIMKDLWESTGLPYKDFKLIKNDEIYIIIHKIFN